MQVEQAGLSSDSVAETSDACFLKVVLSGEARSIGREMTGIGAEVRGRAWKSLALRLWGLSERLPMSI